MPFGIDNGYQGRILETLTTPDVEPKPPWRAPDSEAQISTEHDREARGPSAEELDRQRSTDAVLTLGVGVEYRIARRWLARGQFIHFNDVGDADTTGSDDIQVLMVGAA